MNYNQEALIRNHFKFLNMIDKKKLLVMLFDNTRNHVDTQCQICISYCPLYRYQFNMSKIYQSQDNIIQKINVFEKECFNKLDLLQCNQLFEFDKSIRKDILMFYELFFNGVFV